MGDAPVTKADYETFADIGGRIAATWEHMAIQTRNAAKEAYAAGDEQLGDHESDRAEQVDDRAESVRKAARLAGRFAERL